MVVRVRHFVGLMGIMLAAACVGCGGDGRVAVEGTATWNGQPIEMGFVELFPTDGTGQVDGADIVGGKFSVRTHAGAKRVRVTGQRKIGETPPTERIPKAEPIYAQFIPKEFNDESQLKVEVSSTDPKLELALQGQEPNAGPTLTAADAQRKAAQGGQP
jgi:hypothetical protein